MKQVKEMSIFLQVVKWIVKMLEVIPALIGLIFWASLYFFFTFIEEIIIRFLLYCDLVDPLLIKNYYKGRLRT